MMTITAATTPDTTSSMADLPVGSVGLPDAVGGPPTACGSVALAAVGAALDRAVAGRTTRIAVCGASGTGRTRLIEHARRDAGRRSMRVLATHGRSGDADVPYGSMLTLLHPVADRIPELPTAERDSLQAALDLRHADVDERAARTGLWRLLTRLGEEGPLLITADDSDLMDRASLDVLAFALGRMDSQPVAVLASAASHRATNPLVAIGDELIVLDGLDDGALVAAVQAAVPATEWVAGRISSFSGGNSALAIALVRALTPDQRAGRVACPLVPTPPPEMVRALTPILDSVGGDAATALSVIAADTTDDVAVVRTAVRAVLDDAGRPGDPLVELERTGIISIVGTTARTLQPMLDVVAYDRLGPAERRSVHRALAGAMGAPHHEAGRAWQLASGAEGPDTEVFSAMTAVARHATRRGNLRRAAVAHQRAADFAERHEDRARALARALGCWTAVGDPIAMRRLMGEHVEGGIVTHIAHSAAVRWLAGDAAAVPELRKAAPLATVEEQPLLDALFADAAFAAGHVREAMAAAERLVRDDRAGAGRNLAEALLVLGGRATPAMMGALVSVSYDEAVEVVRSRAVLRHAEAHLRFGDASAAEELIGGATPAGPWDPVERTAIRARLAVWRGQPETARHVLGAALEALPADSTIARAVLLEVVAEVQFLLGDRDSAMATLDDLLPVVRGAAMARREAAARTTVGRIAWSVDEVDIAVACLEQARRIDPSSPIGDLVALLSWSGRADAARTWVAKIDTYPAGEPAPIDVLRARANVADEVTGFQPAVAVLHGSQLPALEAELMVDLAAWSHRRGRWADVFEAAERAVQMFIPSGITGWIERLDRLEPPAAPAPTDVPAALAGLTEAERRVALAISRGLTNKEAAAELFVSVKTIDSHLQRIYPKLFVRSRGELAVLVNVALTASGAPLGNSTGDPPDARR